MAWYRWKPGLSRLSGLSGLLSRFADGDGHGTVSIAVAAVPRVRRHWDGERRGLGHDDSATVFTTTVTASVTIIVAAVAAVIAVIKAAKKPL